MARSARNACNPYQVMELRLDADAATLPFGSSGSARVPTSTGYSGMPNCTRGFRSDTLA